MRGGTAYHHNPPHTTPRLTMPGAPLGDPLCTLALAGGSPKMPGALRWSDCGQALVMTGTALHVLTPAIGLALGDATLPSAASAAHRAALAHFVCSISAPVSDAPFVYTRDAPDALTGGWAAAAWSPAGLGARGACRIAALTARRALVLIDAPHDHVRGPWEVGEPLSTHCTAVDWSQKCPTRPDTALLAGAGPGGVYVWAVGAVGTAGMPAAHAPTHIPLTAAHEPPPFALHWGEWAQGRAPLAVHTRAGVCVVPIAADGRVCGPQSSCALGWTHVGALTWQHGLLLFATPGRMHAWDPRTGAHDVWAAESTRAGAGIVGDPPFTLLQDWRAAGPGATPDCNTDFCAPGTSAPAHTQSLWALAVQGTAATLSETDEPAAWRYRVARRLVYTMWSADSRATGPLDVGAVLSHACTGTYAPAVALRALLVAIVAAPALAAAARAALEPRVHGEESGSLPDDALALRHAELRACTWLAAWLARTDADAVPLRDALARALRDADLERRFRTSRDRDPAYVRRLSAVLHLTGDARRAEQSAALRAALGELPYTDAAPSLGEGCPACGGAVAFADAPFARCAAGHVFGRCAATWALVCDTDTLTCTGCGAHAARAALAASGEPAECMRCGHLWVAP